MTEKCDLCGIRLDRDDWYEFIDGELVCYGCLKREFTRCGDCDEYTLDPHFCEWCDLSACNAQADVMVCDPCTTYHTAPLCGISLRSTCEPE